ncbi:MAG TPA: nucleoside triphosphate pyrophosphohydrolase [Cycloclasticus sp.]|nr:nucleoside triphosphate pyrophosphohydrolase [Cycloclasticus sp.]
MVDKNITSNNKLHELLAIMAQLRDPKSGCPWDLEQDFASIAPYTIEEAYEVAEAIQQGDMKGLKDELGDLLFQVAFHARMAEEQQYFNFDDVVSAICDKLTRRHPHVFDGLDVDKAELAAQWEAHKRQEKGVEPSASILDAVSVHQPAVNQAYKLQKKAASVGFDWGSVNPVFEKLDEEIAELKDEVGVVDNAQRIEEEMGDVLFSCINLARHLNVNPEWSLRQANKRFATRFAYIECVLRDSQRDIETCSAQTLEALWAEAKAHC